MRTPKSGSLSALLSLIVGLVVTLCLMGYGVTEEVPVGNVSGQVVMMESGKALPGAFVTITHIQAAGTSLSYEDVASEHHFRTDKDGKFSLRNVLSGSYKMTVSSKAHSIDSQIIEVVEGHGTSLQLQAKPEDPNLELYASQRVSLPSDSPHLQLKGFAPDRNMSVRIYKLDLDKVVKEGGLYSALAPLARTENGKASDPAQMGNLTKSMEYEIKGRDAEGTFTDRLELGNLTEGLYWVACQLGKLNKGTWLSVSRIAMIVKHSNLHVTAFVTALDSGNPISGAKIGYGSQAGLSNRSVSSSDGLASFDIPASASSGDHAIVIASSGDSHALVDFRPAAPDDSTGDDTATVNGETAQTKIYIYTDRPIYRPGDKVSYKGIVRRLVGSNYVLPKNPTVGIQVQDQDGTVLDDKTTPLNGMGTFSGDYQFSPSAMPADYQIVVTYGKTKESKDVGIAAYHKPTYSIKVDPQKPNYVRGDKAKFMVTTAYYYGSPVVGAKVTAFVDRQPYWDWRDYNFDSEDDFDPSDYEGGSPDQSFSGNSIKDRSGEETQQLTATTDANGKAALEFPTMGVNESSEAQNDFTYTVHVTVQDSGDKSFDGEGSVLVKCSDYDLNIRTDSYVAVAGQPFNSKITLHDSKGSPLPNYPVTLTSGFVGWTDRKEVLQDRQIQTVTTGPDGTASVALKPDGGGFFRVSAQVTDERGHTVQKKQDVYLEGEKSLYNTGTPVTKLNLILDKRQYKEGDTAKALITCKDPGGTALVSLEAAGLYSSHAVKLSGPATVFRFKVEHDFAPDAFVAVEYIKAKKYAETSKRLLVDLGRRKLDVDVTADKKIYHPGDTAVYTVSTKTASGTPTPAEVSLAIVDESIYAIFDDNSDIVSAFYPKRYDDVQTDYSFPELYLGGGDKAPTNIQIRRKFNDTAFWQPVVKTDADGQAKVAVKLPDNLTSWRATVRAVDSNTDVGQATSNVISRKDLMVELSAPNFVVNGDDQRMVAMVTNNTGSGADVKLQLDAKDAKVDGEMSTSVHIDDGAMKTVEYKMTPTRSGEADFVAKAWIPSGASDGVELKVPVTPRARLVTTGLAGTTNAAKSVKITLQSAADLSAGDLTIHVSPNLAVSMLGSINSLVDFPYGCVEQTTSRFLPAVIFGKNYQKMGLTEPVRAKDLPQIVQDSYAKLQAMQHADGGWGWWTYDQSDKHMTGYVLEAVYRAKELGFAPPGGIQLAKALDWAQKSLSDKIPSGPNVTDQDVQEDKTEKIYLAYSLALHGRKPEAKAFLDAQDITRLDSSQAALAALAYDALGSEETKRGQAFSRLMLTAHETPSTVYWTPADWYGYETTGRCFQALQKIAPSDPRIDKVLTYLLQEKRGTMWFSTRDTAAVLIGMGDYLLLHPSRTDINSDIVAVNVNGRPVEGLPSSRSEDMVYKVPVSQLQPGENEVSFTAPTSSFYSVTLNQYVGVDSTPTPNAKGLTVSRSYYKLAARQMEDGLLKLMPSKDPVTDYAPGDILQCQVTIHSDIPRDYLLVEVPTPSGCRVTDREAPDEGEEWNYWWSSTVILDDHVALFASHMGSGDHMLTFNLRAENAGSSHALPTSVSNMYDPAEYASTSEAVIQVSQ